MNILTVSVVNPYIIKKYGDVEMRKVNADKKDAYLLARYALEKGFFLPLCTMIEQKYSALRFLSRQYDQAVAMRAMARVQLSNLIDQIMPGISLHLGNCQFRVFSK